MRIALRVALIAAALAVPARLRAQELGCYERRATWTESLFAARERLLRGAPGQTTARPLPDFGRDDYTLMAWLRTTRGGTIVAKAPAAGPWAPQGKVFFVRDGRLCVDIGWVGAVASNRSVNDGQWHLVAATKAVQTLRFYVDGEPAGGGDLAFDRDPQGFVVKVGYCSDNFPDAGFHGELDEVRVFRGALSPADVKACLTRSAPEGAALLGHWAGENSGADASGSGNDATRLVKVAYGEGKVGRALRFSGDGGHLAVTSGGTDVRESLWALVGRDFPEPANAQEIGFERADGIWRDDWRPGELRALAQRYAQAAAAMPKLAQRAAALAPEVRDWAGLGEVRTLYLAARRYRAFLAAVGDYNLGGLREAMAYLHREYGARYPAAALRARLDALEADIAACRDADLLPADLNARLARVDAEARALRYAVLVTANPLLAFDKLLFVKRQTYQSNHYYTDYINGCRYFGGNLCVLSLRDGTVREVVPELKDGIFGRYDLSFDGRTIVFDHKRQIGEGFRLWTVDVDGRGLRQITVPPADEVQRIARYRINQQYPHHTDDMQPCWLPDGGIAFISTRCEFGILCDSPDLFTTTVLYRLNQDGTGMAKLSNSSVSEASPSVLNDGRLMYTRWEYVDKGAVCVKCLWAMNPDGTNSTEIYGNDIALPPTFLHGRAVPGKSHLVVFVGTPHYPQSGVGTVIRADLSRNIRTREPMTYITPDVDIRGEGGFSHLRDGRWVHDNLGPFYNDACALDEAFYLVACNPDKPWQEPKGYGLYLIDQWGNRVPIYRDPETSCWQPMPLRARPTPPVLPSTLPANAKPGDLATLYMSDVYQGLGNVLRGSVKWLRVVEQVPRPWSARRRWDGDLYDQQHACITKDTHLGLKVIHGIVPVEADGSAYFTAPSDRNLYFQALDENYMEIQRMRTFINLRPGETRACVGCHTPKHIAPAPGKRLALAHPPLPIGPQPGEQAPRPLSYADDVQPVLDRHCVRCHGGDKPDGGLDLRGELTTLWNRSYEAILARKLVKVIGENHPKVGNAEPVPPYSLGSHAAKFVTVLRKGHYECKLPLADWVKLTTWADCNAQYYGSYFGRRNLKYRGLPDFRPVPTIASALGTPPPG